MNNRHVLYESVKLFLCAAFLVILTRWRGDTNGVASFLTNLLAAVGIYEICNYVEIRRRNRK